MITPVDRTDIFSVILIHTHYTILGYLDYFLYVSTNPHLKSGKVEVNGISQIFGEVIFCVQH